MDSTILPVYKPVEDKKTVIYGLDCVYSRTLN